MSLNSLTNISAPIAVNLEITNKCNLSCSFCFNANSVYEELMEVAEESELVERKNHNLKESNLSVIDIRKNHIFRILDQLSTAGVFEVRLFGGEFLVFKGWREVLEYAHNHKFFISFVSNGDLLNEPDIQLLSKYGVKNCTISVHGQEKVHDKIVGKKGSFKRAMESVSLLKQNKITVTIAYTPNVDNIGQLYAFVNFLHTKHGLDFFSVSRLFNDKRYKSLILHDYLFLLEEISRCHRELGVEISLADSFPRCQVPIKYWKYLSYCSQGVGFAQVDFNGNLKHCAATTGVIGNLFETDIKELWAEKLNEMRNLNHLPTSCKICPIFCGGGCTVSRGVENQFAPDEFIPWPEEEGILAAIKKAIYNRARKTMHRILYGHLFKSSSSIEVPSYPCIKKRYLSREEEDGFMVMFEDFGVVNLSPLAMRVLTMCNGENKVSVIVEKCKENFPDCTGREVKEIIQNLPVN